MVTSLRTPGVLGLDLILDHLIQDKTRLIFQKNEYIRSCKTNSGQYSRTAILTSCYFNGWALLLCRLVVVLVRPYTPQTPSSNRREILQYYEYMISQTQGIFFNIDFKDGSQQST